MPSTRCVARSGAAATLVTSATLARRLSVTGAEERVFRWFNGAPDELAVPAWVVTQGGSLGAVFVAAGITQRHRSRHEAATVLAVGVGVWVGTKFIKPLIGRGRPARHLDDVVERGQAQRGLGFPSGHAAVSTTLALSATHCGLRAPALVAAALIGCCRMYSGAHLPLDVGGGVAIGVFVGTAARRGR